MVVKHFYEVRDAHSIKAFLDSVARVRQDFADVVLATDQWQQNHCLATVINAWLPQALPLVAQYDDANKRMLLNDNDTYLWQTVPAWQAAHRHSHFVSDHDEQYDAPTFLALVKHAASVRVLPAPYDAYMQFDGGFTLTQGQWYNQHALAHNHALATHQPVAPADQLARYNFTATQPAPTLLITDIVVSSAPVMAAQQALQAQLAQLPNFTLPANAQLQTQFWQLLLPTYRQVALTISDGYHPVVNMSEDVLVQFMHLLGDAHDDHVIESANDTYLRLSVKQRQHLQHYMLQQATLDPTAVPSLPTSLLPANAPRDAAMVGADKHAHLGQPLVYFDLSGLQTVL